MTLASIGSGFPFLLLLILACPLMMFFMMRGMHGGHGNAANQQQDGQVGPGHGMHGGHGPSGHASEPDTLDDLRRRRDDLEEEIARREQETAETVWSGR